LRSESHLGHGDGTKTNLLDPHYFIEIICQLRDADQQTNQNPKAAIYTKDAVHRAQRSFSGNFCGNSRITSWVVWRRIWIGLAFDPTHRRRPTLLEQCGTSHQEGP